MSHATLQHIKNLTNISGWKETETSYVLDLSNAGIHITPALNAQYVADYAFGTHDGRLAEYTPKASIPELLKRFEALGTSLQGVKMPQPGPGFLSAHFQNTFQVTGNAMGGKPRGRHHVATKITLPKTIADNPKFMEVMEEYKAVKAAFAPLAEQLAKGRQ